MDIYYNHIERDNELNKLFLFVIFLHLIYNHNLV